MRFKLLLLAGLAALAPATAATAADMPGGPISKLRRHSDRDHQGAYGDAYGRGDRLRRVYVYDCRLDPPRPAYGMLVPTNSPCDPTYVGNAYGLARPSYYGTLPRMVGQNVYGWDGWID